MQRVLAVILAVSLVVIVAFGCSKSAPPEADFSCESTVGVVPLTVEFTDESTGEIASWAWDFNDDGEVDSTEQSPIHEYGTAGTYTVSLEVTGPGGFHTETKVDLIAVSAPPAADFTADRVAVIVGQAVTFANNPAGGVLPLSYQWDFNNDGIWDSTAQNPSYVYSAAGTYTVILKVTDSATNSDTETKTGYITVYSVPQANFSAGRTSVVVGQSVQFTNLSSGGIAPFSYQWDFNNDGVWDGTAQNPSYVYSAAGTYTVVLKVTDSATNTDTETKDVAVSPPPPQADFTFGYVSGELLLEEPIAGTVPLTVQFNDQSSGEITSWRWNFGDGTVIEGSDAALRNPVHTYQTPNSSGFIVSLTVRGPGGVDQKSEPDIVAVFSCSEAANVELNLAKLAIKACLSAAGKTVLDSAIVGWDGSPGMVTAGGIDAADYLGVWKTFKATYDMAQDGTITSGTDVSWGCVKWTLTGMGWRWGAT
jgi:PKD repeat protein